MNPKFLDMKNLQQTQDFAHDRYFVKLRPTDTFADLFLPTFWSYHRNRLKQFDIVRVVAHDHSFDVDLTVASVNVTGAVMKVRPLFGDAVGVDALAAAIKQAAEAKLTTVPFASDGKPEVRIEFLPATQWRVVGLRGFEVARDLKSEAEAGKAMSKYLTDSHLEMPTAEAIEAAADAAKSEADKAKAAVEAKKKAKAA
jgi:hypothetical protein